MKVDQYYFFPETYFVSSICGGEFTVWLALIIRKKGKKERVVCSRPDSMQYIICILSFAIFPCTWNFSWHTSHKNYGLIIEFYLCIFPKIDGRHKTTRAEIVMGKENNANPRDAALNKRTYLLDQKDTYLLNFVFH